MAEEQERGELTIPQAGQLIGRSPAQVTRLITLGLLAARRDARGWWRIDAESARRFAERQREPAPAA
jgi:hypothetical protein